ncbi:MAG TPA: hypothetical protein VEI06_05845 [Gemmatimonadaceae bacterium]|nr:hypothetical protein [Gemmatimonadaceae bacterium]
MTVDSLPVPTYPAPMLKTASGWAKWNGAPLLFESPRYLILAATPLSMAWLATSASLQPAAGSCSKLLAGSDTANAWKAFDDFVGASPLVVFQVMPYYRRSPAQCLGGRLPSSGVASRGIAVLERYDYDAYIDVRTVVAYVNGHPISPFMVGRAPLRVAGTSPSLANSRASSQVRVYLPVGALAPDSLGRFPNVTLKVFGQDSALATFVPISEAAVRQLWTDFMPWRLTVALPPQPPPPGFAPVLLPTPSDTALRHAQALYREGSPSEAAESVFTRMHAVPLSRDDSLIGSMQMALALMAVDDRADAIPQLHGVLTTHPCLTLSSTAPETYKRLLDELRPPARCDYNVAGTTLRSIVPGWGQYAQHRWAIGGLVTGGVVTAILLAAREYSSSNNTYNTVYLEAIKPSVATQLYDEASSERQSARAFAFAAGAFWLGGMIDAVVFEALHANEVRQVQNFGASPIVRSDAGRLELGLSLSIQ